MKYYTSSSEFNCGIDLHSKQMYVCIMDRVGEVLVHRNVKGNDFDYFLKIAKPHLHDLTVVCECTFNWYWLADACFAADIEFVLAHALYLRHISGGKNKNDRIGLSVGPIGRRVLPANGDNQNFTIPLPEID